MDKLGKLLNRHAISFKVESNLAGNFIKSTTSATHYNVADEIVNELNEIKRGQECSNEETAALPLPVVVQQSELLKAFCDEIYKFSGHGFECMIDGFIKHYNESL